jgi:hypothetical protein
MKFSTISRIAGEERHTGGLSISGQYRLRVLPQKGAPSLAGRRLCGHYSCRSILVELGPPSLRRFATARRSTISLAGKISAKALTASNGFCVDWAFNFLRKPRIEGGRKPLRFVYPVNNPTPFSPSSALSSPDLRSRLREVPDESNTKPNDCSAIC